jgi:hypothetical protein
MGAFIPFFFFSALSVSKTLVISHEKKSVLELWIIVGLSNPTGIYNARLGLFHVTEGRN